MSVIKKIKSKIETIYYPTYLSKEHLNKIPFLLNMLGEGVKILNIGSGGQNYAPNVVNLDIFKSSTTHVLGDAHKIPFADKTFDCVVSVAVFEHLQKPWIASEEISRVLKEGGVVYIEVPFLQPYHADPTDYFRYTIQGLRSLFDNFNEIQSGILDGPASALSWILVEFGGILFDRRGKFEEKPSQMASKYFILAKSTSRMIVTPIKYLDMLLLKKEHAYVIASGIYYMGKKS